VILEEYISLWQLLILLMRYESSSHMHIIDYVNMEKRPSYHIHNNPSPMLGKFELQFLPCAQKMISSRNSSRLKNPFPVISIFIIFSESGISELQAFKQQTENHFFNFICLLWTRKGFRTNKAPKFAAKFAEIDPQWRRLLSLRWLLAFQGRLR